MADFLNMIPGTDIEISRIGLGTVKIGRNQQVKYPDGFKIPEDEQVLNLLSVARDCGINLIDTAPAYGVSEQRLGILINNRQDWVISTKVGEEFEHGQSTFDFSALHTRRSVERSLKRLKTDYLDIVLIHSDGNDLDILEHTDCLETLLDLKQQGMVRAVGMSTKTDAGGVRAAQLTDIVMLTYNLDQQDQQALDCAVKLHKGIFIKKGLSSGHALSSGENTLQHSLKFIFKEPAVNSVIIGTINPVHLRQNTDCARQVLENIT